MSRLFDNNASDYIDIGDVATARFTYADAWTYLTFIRVENTSGDERAFVRKYGASGARQIRFRVTIGVAPQSIELRVNTSSRLTGGAVIALNTWYLVCVSKDTSSSGVLYTFDMTGTALDDGLSWTHPGDAADLTAAVQFGLGATDPFDGDLALCAYVNKQLTKQQCLEYLYNPFSVMKYKGDGIAFFLPMNGSSPEVDWSGSTNNGTVNGSPTVGDNPPVVFSLGFGALEEGELAASIIPVVYHHRQRNQ